MRLLVATEDIGGDKGRLLNVSWFDEYTPQGSSGGIDSAGPGPPDFFDTFFDERSGLAGSGMPFSFCD